MTCLAKAIILAAGKSSKFFPPLYDKPKGLFTFQGEVLIERQIRQLQDAGITDITVIVGYEKEQFFYLEKKFDVSLVVSEKFQDESNLSSLYLVKDKLPNCYICCADHWYKDNPFLSIGYDKSIRMVSEKVDAQREFIVTQQDNGLLTSLKLGAAEGLCMVGFAFFTPAFAERFIELYECEQNYIKVRQLFWEEFWGIHVKELPLYGLNTPNGVLEFDSLSDLQELDGNVLENVSSDALANIIHLLKCNMHDIKEIAPLNKGLTNVSFSFVVNDKKYVYRQPGASSLNMVNRTAEVHAQKLAIDLEIDASVIAIDETGWKLSTYIDSVKQFSYEDIDLLEKGINQILKFQEASKALDCEYEVNLLSEGYRLQGLAANKKNGIVDRNTEIYKKLQRLERFFQLDEWEKTLCHNDTYIVNWIVGEDALCLIDWEYAGLNDPVNDIATLIVRDGLDDKIAEKIMSLYFKQEPSFEQRRHAYACFALCGWYWYNWSLFKDTLGEDGFFMLNSWRAMNKYLPLALEMYETPENFEGTNE